MPSVSTSTTAVLELEDGTSPTPVTIEVYPQEGDVVITPGDDVVVELKHRGRPIANGEGIIMQEQGYLRLTFSLYAHDFADDDEKLDAWLRWMRKTDDSSATAVAGAATSTTTRTDKTATVNALWYPHGKVTGRRFCRAANMKLVKRTIEEAADGSKITVELASVSSSIESWGTVA